MKKTAEDYLGEEINKAVLEEEIKYAKSQIQDHDTGHIYTAINWMESRLNQLRGIEKDE
jgi:uncharacterized protein YhjY with autotransporter beta-barrel domain